GAIQGAHARVFCSHGVHSKRRWVSAPRLPCEPHALDGPPAPKQYGDKEEPCPRDSPCSRHPLRLESPHRWHRPPSPSAAGRRPPPPPRPRPPPRAEPGASTPPSIAQIDLRPPPGRTYFQSEREWREEFIYFLMVGPFQDDQGRARAARERW